MNEKQKIELGDFIADEVKKYLMPGSRLAFPLFEAGELEVAEAVLSKIKELEQCVHIPPGYTLYLSDEEITPPCGGEIPNHATKQKISPLEIQQIWRGGKLIGSTDYNDKTPDPVKYTTRCICHNLLDNKTSYKAHICGVCYQAYCDECLVDNFDTCQDCRDVGRARKLVRDKNGTQFYTGCTLRNESSLTTSVKILQINETHIVSDPGGCVEIQDFIDAGWIVHERVTTYRTDESGTICIDKCDFMSNEIGSLNCAECDHSQNKRGKDWIICELYNKENEDEK